jgi:hypothetical protein
VHFKDSHCPGLTVPAPNLPDAVVTADGREKWLLDKAAGCLSGTLSKSGAIFWRVFSLASSFFLLARPLVADPATPASERGVDSQPLKNADPEAFVRHTPYVPGSFSVDCICYLFSRSRIVKCHLLKPSRTPFYARRRSSLVPCRSSTYPLHLSMSLCEHVVQKNSSHPNAARAFFSPQLLLHVFLLFRFSSNLIF